jgi:hypothetical protein
MLLSDFAIMISLRDIWKRTLKTCDIADIMVAVEADTKSLSLELLRIATR